MSRRLFNFSETLKTIYNNKLPLYIYLHPFYTLSNRPALSRLKKAIKKNMEKQNDVVVRLAKHVIDTVADGSNLVFSPTSINLLLSIIAAGSCAATKEQILSFLMSPSTEHLNTVLTEIVSVALADGSERNDLSLSTANGAWIDKSLPLKLSFKELLENSYKATCSQVDFFNKVTLLSSLQWFFIQNKLAISGLTQVYNILW